ncbi:hypothetical protein ABAZ39_08075 [Azospirillum argentinense]|uniref:Uncharacterized protein n=1 Tax=Azospirillum argentinense TaxID=2970906 RepID=A0A060DGL0_9PROT|nr:hypothetical protein [Azospirillum argentinense]AIB11957.1 hypothetical protein ABAZ39_08075 [Azospirillum argentinense]EZQ08829.1 hypothetical protein ABAZ39_09490 [Azospirillum argentinense]
MPLDALLLPLIVKIVAAALVVVAASLAAEKAGPFYGGMITALPVSTGPAFVMLAMEHGDGFVADAALSGMVGNATIVLYLALLVRIAPRWSMPATVIASSVFWIATAATLRSAVAWTLPLALLLTLACYGIAAWAVSTPIPQDTVVRVARSRWYDIPARAGLVGLLVATVTTLSHSIGPAATGIAAVFPIALTSLTAILHGRLGGGVVAAAMRSALLTNPGLALALTTAHLLAEPAGRFVALGVALAVSLSWAGGLLVWRLRQPA